MRRYILTSLPYHLREAWVQRADMWDPSEIGFVRFTVRLVRVAPTYSVVVLNGSSHREQIAALALRRLRPSVPLVLSDCTWKAGRGRLKSLARRLGIAVLDNERTHYCVLSTDEQRSFPTLWRVSPARVHFTPWSYGVSPEDLDAATAEEPYVFAGGDSMRHYGSLVEAARHLSHPVFIASRTRPGITKEVPTNLTVNAVSRDEYVDAMRRAKVVVVALEGHTERSAGQANYLDAMAMGKCVVVVDGTGVRDYVEDGKTARVVPPNDASALVDAIAWAFDPRYARERQSMQEEARRVARRHFGPDQYAAALIAVVDEVAAAHSRSEVSSASRLEEVSGREVSDAAPRTRRIRFRPPLRIGRSRDR